MLKSFGGFVGSVISEATRWSTVACLLGSLLLCWLALAMTVASAPMFRITAAASPPLAASARFSAVETAPRPALPLAAAET